MMTELKNQNSGILIRLLSTSNAFFSKYQKLIKMFRFLQSSDPSLKDEDINRAVGLLWTNAFACSNGGGQAVFPTFSFMSHSCVPNCAHSVFPNKTLALQAKIKINAGEEFTISYISTVQVTRLFQSAFLMMKKQWENDFQKKNEQHLIRL